MLKLRLARGTRSNSNGGSAAGRSAPNQLAGGSAAGRSGRILGEVEEYFSSSN
ncbi:MAG: hypothetical protein U1E87_00390 [Alphaproteobacteria bacterium]